MSLDNDHPHVGTSHRVATILGAVADGVALVDDSTLREHVCFHYDHRQGGFAVVQLAGGVPEQEQVVVADTALVVMIEVIAVELLGAEFALAEVVGGTYSG
jgi:hypothetical protein